MVSYINHILNYELLGGKKKKRKNLTLTMIKFCCLYMDLQFNSICRLRIDFYDPAE